MSDPTRKHLSLYRHRIAAAQMASGILMQRRHELDHVTWQALEAVVFQRDERVEVLEFVQKIAREGGAAAA